MKRHFFMLVIGFAAFILYSCKSNEKTIWVHDTEHVLTYEQITSLDSLYKAHEKKTTNEIMLVTSPNYGTDTSMMLFAVNLGKKYGVGKKEKNNGVVIAFSNTMRQTSIATGYGTEKVLTNQISKKIIDSLMIPYFRKAKIFQGLWEGSKAIITFLETPMSKIK